MIQVPDRTQRVLEEGADALEPLGQQIDSDPRPREADEAATSVPSTKAVIMQSQRAPWVQSVKP